MIDQKTVIKLNENFSGLTLDMIKNQINNQDRDPRGCRYSDEVKKFALTLSFHSLRADKYIHGVLSLSHSNSLIEWTSSVNCEPGSFMDVLQNLKAKIDENPLMQNVLCCAMS